MNIIIYVRKNVPLYRHIDNIINGLFNAKKKKEK